MFYRSHHPRTLLWFVSWSTEACTRKIQLPAELWGCLKGDCPISAFQIPAQQKRVTWAGTAESVCRNSTARSSTCCQSRAHCGHRDRALRLQVTTGLPQLQVCEGVKPLPLCSCWDLNSQGDTSPVCREVREPKPPQCLPGRFGALAPTSVQLTHQ